MIARRKLGRTNINISELGFGGAPLGDLYAHLDDRQAIDAVRTALDAGIRYVDTAPLYGHGLSEHRIGTAIRSVHRSSLVLSTKVGRWMSPAGGEWDREGYAGGLPFAAHLDYGYDGTLRAIEQSLQRLGTNRLDIVLIHDVDRRNHGDRLDQRFREAIKGAWHALRRMREEGVIGAAGIGVNEAEICLRFAEACDLDCVMLAGRYSLLDQGALHTFLPVAEKRGIGVLLGGVFNSGVLATGAVPGATYDYAPASAAILERVKRIEAVCTRHGVALPVAAIHAVRHHPAVASVVLGATSPAEVSRNLASWNASVPADLWAELKQEGLIDRDMPVDRA
ncbi:MAG: aldo/keto reductase [Beijerinckiaceae bacterium]|jgi:D-threo-aldose 1-dehydrogenase|nr:aldo/keto reductase [Beijerinckiaceae bacterium]